MFYFSQYFCCSFFLKPVWCMFVIFYRVQYKHSHALLQFCEAGLLYSSFWSLLSLSLPFSLNFFAGKVVLALFFFQHYILKLLSHSIFGLKCVHEFHTYIKEGIIGADFFTQPCQYLLFHIGNISPILCLFLHWAAVILLIYSALWCAWNKGKMKQGSVFLLVVKLEIFRVL